MNDEDKKPATSSFKRKQKGHSNNTCGRSSKMKRLNLQLVGILAHLENHPQDNLSRARVSRIKEELGG